MTMTGEDFQACLVFGFILGVAVFAGGVVRIRSARAHDAWIQSTNDWFRDLFGPLIAANRIADFLGLVAVASGLVYGACVAPKLRYALLAASITVVALWFAWRTIARWRMPG